MLIIRYVSRVSFQCWRISINNGFWSTDPWSDHNSSFFCRPRTSYDGRLSFQIVCPLGRWGGTPVLFREYPPPPGQDRAPSDRTWDMTRDRTGGAPPPPPRTGYAAGGMPLVSHAGRLSYFLLQLQNIICLFRRKEKNRNTRDRISP